MGRRGTENRGGDRSGGRRRGKGEGMNRCEGEFWERLRVVSGGSCIKARQQGRRFAHSKLLGRREVSAVRIYQKLHRKKFIYSPSQGEECARD